MSAPSHIARENGRKGGRPKGSKASHTLQIQWAKKQLIKTYIENIRPINKALIDKALTGDIAAIRELNDRVYGKASQPIEGSLMGNVNITFDKTFNVSSDTSR